MLTLQSHPFFVDQDYFAQQQAFINNPAHLPGQTEEFDEDYCFCLKRSGGHREFAIIYNADQADYNRQVAETAVVMSDLLVRCRGEADHLDVHIRDYLAGYANRVRPYGLLKEARIDDWARDHVLVTHTESPTERFLSILALHRHLMAVAAGSEHAEFFGYNRNIPVYAAFDSAAPDAVEVEERHVARIDLILRAGEPRTTYADSVDRFKQSEAFKLHLAEMEEAGEDPISEHEITRPDWPYVIQRELNGEDIPHIGYMEHPARLVNTIIEESSYHLIYDHLDSCFSMLTQEDLPEPAEFLKNVFTIQYWFIHIMPYARGASAVLSMFRYAMTAYYNRRAREIGRFPLPIVPQRVDWHPDLEALLSCPTPEAFIDKSMREIYCVDFRVYCN